MRKVIIRKPLQVAPFNEPARDLRVLNKPLWGWQRDLLAPYCDEEVVVADASNIPRDPVEMLVHSDNLWFDKPFLTAFSDSDPITRGGDSVFQKLIPGARGLPHTTIQGAGHFLQEDRGEELARVVVDLIARY